MSAWNPRANRNTLWASVFAEELARGGVRQAVIAPGSRSTPLTLALAAHSGIEARVLLDERGAAFFALGLAKASARPVVLVCTSGTAAANFHPAVLEADLSAVPLIVVTADRPPMLRSTGAAQTVDQLKLYGSAVRWFHEVGEPVIGGGDLRRLRGLTAQALFAATRAPAGPVHLNFPFRKPLEAQPVPGDIPASLDGDDLSMTGLEDGPFVVTRPARPAADGEVLERIAARIEATPRGLIWCGPMSGFRAPGDNGRPGRHEWPESLAVLARQAGYPILAEPPSGVMCGTHDTTRVIPHADLILQAPAFRDRLRPGLVLRFGGMPTGTPAHRFLEEHPGCPVVLINEEGAWLNPTHHPGELICAEPARFCGELAERLKGRPAETPWLTAFQEAGRAAARAIAEAYEEAPPGGLAGEWFEGRVFSELAALLPPGALQYTASSMPVRDLAMFTPLSPHPVRHLVNRGANGIDGTLSSALGAACALKEAGGGPAVLVTGDLAFHHDANALLTARELKVGLTIVLLNNNGGGIFEMLPIAEYGDTYETYFGTPHGIDFSGLCAAYGVAYSLPDDWEAFRGQVRAGMAGGVPNVIEIRTDRAVNREQHQRVYGRVAGRLARDFPPRREF